MMYASPMTNDATQTVDKDATQLIAAKDALSPGLGRYFGTTSPLTKLRNRTAINVAKIKQSGLVTAFSSFNISSIALTLFPQSPAHADSANSNWGIVQWGWTTEEQRLIDSNQTYSVLQNDEYLSDTINATIESEYGKCFTSSMGTLLKDGDIKRTDTGDVVKTGTTCSPESLGPNNPKYGDKVFRWRLSKKRQAVLDHNLEMQNPTEDSATPNPSGDGSSAGANATAAEVLAQCKNNTATGKVKIVCSSLTLMGIPYGAMGTAGYLTKNPPVVGCNSYTNISIMRATAGKYKGEYCSQTYENEGVKDGNFKKIPLSEVAPGDIVIRESSCGCTSECGGNGADSQGRFGHVAIVVSYDKATDKLVASEATGHSKPSGISDPKTATWSSSNIYGFTYGMVYTGGGL